MEQSKWGGSEVKTEGSKKEGFSYTRFERYFKASQEILTLLAEACHSNSNKQEHATNN